MFRRSAAAACAALFMLLVGGCGGSVPETARTGPRLAAELEREWTTGGAPARQSVFSPDGAMLATSDAGGRITLRRTGDWGVEWSFDHPGGATAVAFGTDGRLLFTAGYDGLVRRWDLNRRRAAGVLRGARGTVWTLDVAPDGELLAAAGEDATIRIWNLASPGEPTLLRGHERNVWEVRFSPDGRRLASGSFDASARLWDAASGRALAVLAGHSEAVVGLAYSPAGRLIATGGDDSTVRLWRAADGAPLRVLDNVTHAHKLEFSPDGRWLASAGRARGGVGTVWHQITGAGGAGAPVHLWRVSDGAIVAALAHPDDVMYVTFSPDGRQLVTGGEDGVVRLWRLREVGGGGR